MKTFEIYYRDLSTKAQEQFDEMFGDPDTFNHDIAPLAIYEQEEQDD